MTLRSNGSYIGPRPAGPSSAAASGIWDLRTAERQRRAAAWPMPFGGPTEISGLGLWLDASDASTLYDATTGGSLVAADGAVARWEDKSGSANHVTVPSGGSGPTRSVAEVNGLDALTFSSQLLTRSALTVNGSAASLFIVAKFAASGFQIAGGFGTNSSYAGLTIEANRSSGQHTATFGSNAASSESSATGGSVTTTTKVFAAVFGSGTGTLYINGTSSASTPFGSNIAGASGFSIGSFFGALPIDGVICEVVYLSRTATAQEISDLQSYFSAKWGL